MRPVIETHFDTTGSIFLLYLPQRMGWTMSSSKLIVTIGVTCVEIEDIMIFPLDFCIVMKVNHHKNQNAQGGWRKREWTHCPNSGPHFTSYRTYTKDAFLYREKNSAPVVMLYCENFYSSPVRHTWSWHNFPSVTETPCDTGRNCLPSFNKFYALFVCWCNPLRYRY